VINDDGVGFDASAAAIQASGRQSLGLFSIRERMRHIGGELRIDSQLGEATTVTLSAPIKCEETISGSM
jgi:signal transduction histidine kinase